jgi:hypothetical protein
MGGVRRSVALDFLIGHPKLIDGGGLGYANGSISDNRIEFKLFSRLIG